MIAAHHACADDADAKRTFRLGFCARCGPLGTHIFDPNRLSARERPGVLLARRHTCGECLRHHRKHVLIQRITQFYRRFERETRPKSRLDRANGPTESLTSVAGLNLDQFQPE
jgi:hypothetical protein